MIPIKRWLVKYISIKYEQISLLLIFCLNAVKCFQVLLFNTYNSVKHHSFVYTHLTDQTVLFLTIQFSFSHYFALSINVKRHYLIHR